jgi:hypothetical protein
MRRFGGLGLLTLATFAGLVTASRRARAEDPRPAPVRFDLPARFSLPPLYPSERLRLTWPIAPVRFTLTELLPIGLGFAKGPTEYFVAESVWLSAGPLSLRTRTESVEAIELDCTSYTCAPVREIALTTEARLDLGAISPAIPSTHLFWRHKTYAGTGAGFVKPGVGRVQLGWGGLLDL